MAEKGRNGSRPVKLPKSIFSKWKAILNNHAETRPDSVYIPAAVALQELIRKEDEPWEQQVVHLKTAAKTLQTRPKNALQESDLEQILTIVEPIASSGYFAASENLSRRHFVPLIEASAKYHANTHLQQCYEQYISINEEAATLDDHDFSQKALTIYATLDFDMGKAMVVRTLKETLWFLASSLELSQQLLLKNTSNVDPTGTQHLSTNISATKSVEVDQLMNDLQHLTKTILALMSRFGVGKQLVFSKLTDGTQDEEVRFISMLTKILLDIATNTSTYVKECNQIAGMTLAAIINLAEDPAFARDWVLGWFFTTADNIPEAAKHMTKVLGVAPVPSLASNGWIDRDAPMLSIVRGFVSNLRKEVLLEGFAHDVQLIQPLKSFVPMRNLHQTLFYSINLFCSRPELDSQSKVIAFDSMAMWLLETKNMMLSCTEDARMMDELNTVLKQDNIDRLVCYVWDYWDDPVDALQHKVRSIFELVLTLLEVRANFYNTKEDYQEFLLALLKELIRMDWHRKVKYSLLNILVAKLGTDSFLQVEPEFIWKCLRQMDSLILSPQITALLLAFLYRRVEETIPGYSPFKGQNAKLKAKDDNAQLTIDKWIELWTMPILKCMTSSSDLLRRNASGFILQPLFKICSQSFWNMMNLMQDTQNACWSVLDQRYRLHAFIAVMKVGRSLDIVEGNAYTMENATTQPRMISVDTLKLAIYHQDPQVRIDALGLICESRKAASIVTSTELDMLKLFLPLNMNCTSPEFRQKLCAHLTKFMTRLRGNLYAQYRNYKSRHAFAEKNAGKRSEKDLKQALTEAANIWQEISCAKDFLYWLNEHIMTSLYPGSSYQRVSTALRILNILIKVFGIKELPAPEGFTVRPDFPFKIPLASCRNTKVLIESLMNPYDFNRVQAFEILTQFPTPLPGVENKEDVQQLLWWGLNNVVSTRAGESDSGAMIFRLIFTKYVVELGFDLAPEQTSGQIQDVHQMDEATAAVVFTERLLDLLEKQVEVAKNNLLYAAQHQPIHGTLLALQYVFRELDYSSPRVLAQVAEWRQTHMRALALIHTVCATVMDVLSNPSPEGNVPSSFREMEEAIDDLIGDSHDVEETEDFGPKHQVILSCCWRAVKEASSLLEVIVSRAPVSLQNTQEAVITYSDMVESGVLLRVLLTSIRHRGAFSAVYPAYVSLNARLLTSSVPTIRQLPSNWLEENLASLTSSNISITRRSAGLPLCILAIVSSELSSKKELLDRAMKKLFELSSTEPPADSDQKIDLPQVHAYNILRTIFMDSKLGSSVLEYASDGFSLAISGFSSSSWAIRNCSVMLFSTLLQRTFGTKKTRDEHSNVNKLTGREFFTRYPHLHPYLLKELDAAVKQLLANSMAASVHPGLYPILTLLSRLHPSGMDGIDKVNAMAPFVPLVSKCAASSIFKTKEMTARALVPLVSSTDLVPTVVQLLTLHEQLTQNEIHGRLLQVQFLLRGHLYQSSLREPLLEFAKTVPSIILASLGVWREYKLNHMTHALLLDIVGEFFFDCKWIDEGNKKDSIDELMSLATTEFPVLQDAIVEHCREGIFHGDISDIGAYLLRQKMAGIIVSATLKKGDALDDILRLMEDRDYEVRLIVMEKLKAHFSTPGANVHGAPEVRMVQEKLVQMTYGAEKHLNCYVLASQFLMSLQASKPYPEDSAARFGFSLEQYWDRLVEQLKERKSLSVTESLLPLLGALLSQILCSDSSDEWKQQCLTFWSNHIVSYSHQDATLSLREASAESIHYIAKALFAQNETTSIDSATVSVQLAIIQLLQDDDIDVRHMMAGVVSDALQLPAPVHPERAVELVYLHLGKRSTYSIHLQEYLSQVVSGGKPPKRALDEELLLTKTLFAKETPNIYKEDLIDIQWASVNLDLLHIQHSVPFVQWVHTHCATYVKDVAKQVLELIYQLKDLSPSMMQHGPYGVTSRPAIFLASYRKLLALNNAYQSVDGLKDSALLEVTKELNDALRELPESIVHPLLWQQLRGEDGLSSKTAHALRSWGQPLRYNMFLLTPN
ncbi:hypothetical protein DFQ28_008852 [Apophysomyces sp. BC1034]|nr:hypothetical protein DFQ29_005736 [Apophysomyces sp. BC1021]KAG0194594.1 hypothetical protein DFQ28_008852 [Apophysomyces sp. BC1034]